MYAKGRGAAKDESKAVKLWQSAAAQGFVQAQFNLGTARSNHLKGPLFHGIYCRRCDVR
jgi:TPR repeat protein